MDLSFKALRSGIAADWAAIRVLPSRFREIDKSVAQIVAGRARYEPVQAATMVPWFFIGAIHLREASGDFHSNLANGDSLLARTHHVPRGRPTKGEPPFTWEEAAIDALKYDDLDGIADWSFERMAYEAELYNGFGPREFGRKSGYVWAGSNIYNGGKFIADSVWSSSTWDTQLGVMTIIRRMVDTGAIAAPAGGVPETTTAPTPDHSVKALQAALNALGADLMVDGIAGPKTEEMVRIFQKTSGLAVDGVAGPKTWAAIDAALASPAA